MKRIVINSTEGGAKIKGTIQLSLKEVIEKYCQEPIDKSVIKPLLTPAEDGDELIEKVIPLLQNDIDNLDIIITNSRKGMAVSHGIKTLINQKKYTKLLPKKKRKLFDKLNQQAIQEAQGNKMLSTPIFFELAIAKLHKSRLKTIMIMSNKNHIFSQSAHIAATKNPLINVAIYGASRAIQSRPLSAKAGINHFLMNQKDAITRIERNMIILKAAYTAAKGLKKSYKKTLKLLKKYNETKDDSLLVSSEVEEIDLSDAEDYFEAGNWAHPYIDSEKALIGLECLNDTDVSPYNVSEKRAKEIHKKSLDMRNTAIEKAKADEIKYHDKMTKLVKYNELIEEAKTTGRIDKDFDKALKLMREAIALMPDEQEARWGLASALKLAGHNEESFAEYEKLIEDFPDIHIFRFEYGQNLLVCKRIQEGLKQIGIVMENTDEYDYFLAKIGAIYAETNMFEEALVAYNSYLDKFPFDYKIWYLKGNCHLNLGQGFKQAQKAYKKSLEIKQDYKLAKEALLIIQKN
jgi:tetratricopeptide (TPR) repeat protein